MTDQEYAELLAHRVVDDAGDLGNAAGYLRNAIRDGDRPEARKRVSEVVTRAESAIQQAKEAVRRLGE